MYETLRDVERASHPIYASQAWASKCASLADELVPVVHTLQEAGFAVSVAVRFGDPIEEIVRFVETEGVGLVAMATHGRTGLSRLVTGSVAEGVLHRLQVPVLLMRPCDGLTNDDVTERGAALNLQAR
jgi:nucleotide-binding universal stress UspA family protein